MRRISDSNKWLLWIVRAANNFGKSYLCSDVSISINSVSNKKRISYFTENIVNAVDMEVLYATSLQLRKMMRQSRIDASISI